MHQWCTRVKLSRSAGGLGAHICSSASSDDCCNETVSPSGEQCFTETVAPAGEHYCTKNVAPPSDFGIAIWVRELDTAGRHEEKGCGLSSQVHRCHRKLVRISYYEHTTSDYVRPQVSTYAGK